MGYLGAFERRSDPETGLVQMGVRQYDPAAGRFLSEDPILGALGLGQSTDRYGYVADDPLNCYDLSGQWPTTPSISLPSLPSIPSPGDLLGGIHTGVDAVGDAVDWAGNTLADAGNWTINAAGDAVARSRNAVLDIASWVADRAHDFWKTAGDLSGAYKYGVACLGGGLYAGEAAPEAAIIAPELTALAGCAGGVTLEQYDIPIEALPPVVHP
jgi:RHS repeat-associated protein